MGALFQNVCYPTQEMARVQACSKVDVKVMSTTNLYTTECTSATFTTANMTLCKRINGGACTNVSQPWPVTPACAHDGGVTLAYDWFLASMVFFCIVYGGKRLISLFDRPTIET